MTGEIKDIFETFSFAMAILIAIGFYFRNKIFIIGVVCIIFWMKFFSKSSFGNRCDKYILRIPELVAADGKHSIGKVNEIRAKSAVETLRGLILRYLEIRCLPINKYQKSYATYAWTQLREVVEASTYKTPAHLRRHIIIVLDDLIFAFLKSGDSQTVKEINESITYFSISRKIVDFNSSVPAIGMQGASNQTMQIFQSQSDKYEIAKALKSSVKRAFGIANDDINKPFDDNYFAGRHRVILAYFDDDTESLLNNLRKMFSKDRLDRLESNQVQTELWILHQYVEFVKSEINLSFQYAIKVNHPFIKKLLLWNFGIAQLLDDLSQSPHCTEQQAKEFLTQSQSFLCISIESINSLDHLDGGVANDIIDTLFASRHMHSMKDVITDKLLLCTFKCGGKTNNGPVLAKGINRCIIIAIENDTALDEKPAANKLKGMLKCHLDKLYKYGLNEDILYDVVKHLEVEQLNLEGKRYLKESNHRDYTRLLHKIVDIIKRFKS